MKRLSIIPEIFIWLAFSVVAGFGYAFSFFEYIGGRAELTATDIVMPTLVWLLLAVICTFLLRMVQKNRCFIHFSKYESVFLEISVLLLLLVGGCVFRYAEYFQGLWPVNPDNEFFHYAQVTQQSDFYSNPHPASRLYVGFLHIIFMFVGNIYEAGTLTQFVLLLLGVLFWYLALRKAFGVVTALFFTAGAMLLPDSIVTSMQYNPAMLLFAVYGVIAWFMAVYAEGKTNGFGAFLSEFLLGCLVSLAVMLDISGWIFVIVFVIALRRHHKNCEKNSFMILIASCLGIIFGANAFTYVQSVIYGISFQQASEFLAYPSLILQMPNLESIQEFVFTLAAHPIFIVAIAIIATYWLMNRRQVSTWIMFGVVFLLALQMLKLDIFLNHNFLIYTGLLVLLGTSIQQFVCFLGMEQAEEEQKCSLMSGDTAELPDLSFLSEKKEEPIVEEIRFEEQPAVTVPVKEDDRPVIFIPKSMDIPKRVSKPKVEFAVEVTEEKMHYDLEIEENADFDI